MNITVVGAGYVGLTLSACLANMGHLVTCVEKDSKRLQIIRDGRLPFYEPKLADLMSVALSRQTLQCTDALEQAIEHASIVFAAVGTPSDSRGNADLTDLMGVVESIARIPGNGKVFAIKSTIPVGTTDRITRVITEAGNGADVAVNPEFLREGAAVNDFFSPYRVVIGTHSAHAAARLTSLYAPLDCPIIVASPKTAEMIKYASNAFLATRISFVNEIASTCEAVGADMNEVAAGMGLDPRIGPHYLRAGIGFGGSCLPKDVRALVALARSQGILPFVLQATLDTNEARRARFVDRVQNLVGDVRGKCLAVLGLSFKPDTSDVRDSPALDIVRRLLAIGAHIQAYDPVAEEAAAADVPQVTYCASALDAVDGADAALILTDWPEFRQIDWKRIERERGLIVIRAWPDGDSGFVRPAPTGRVHQATTA